MQVADYRVIFTISPDELTIIRVRHRSDVYR
ncbi:MAG: type II toxin-antitoxin system RelE/ParE family toxin [Acidobacteria bacterium]|nr:type II toxin-antitoxin system RelE/ParE family toxin [Acidobacteriota bacterium]